VVVGENLRFGRDATGDVARLTELGAQLGFEGVGVELARDGSPWSSTRVRVAIAEGDIPGARVILGRDPEIEGIVVTGDRRGRELGFPTANVDTDVGVATPAAGVYSGLLVVEEDRLPAAISVGTNQHFGGQEMRVEAYALDREDLDLYGSRVRLEFRSRLRDQATFPSLEDYLDQMKCDVESVRRSLAESPRSGP
jgi:riboflavin kinase/FMN adenylyltransferase